MAKGKSITPEQIKEWKEKAAEWDALDKKIGKFYETDENGQDVIDGDLGDIGEIAARAFGYL